MDEEMVDRLIDLTGCTREEAEKLCERLKPKNGPYQLPDDSGTLILRCGRFCVVDGGPEPGGGSPTTRYLAKKAKMLLGYYRTRTGQHQAYDPARWWDGFYRNGVSDSATLAPAKNKAASAYHYASVEMLICRYLAGENRDLSGAAVCDLGSGAGHWIDFYLGLGAGKVLGVDISSKVTEALKERYKTDLRVEVITRSASDVEPWPRFDLVNAIGTMFHLVGDDQWQKTIFMASTSLQENGLFVVSGHFGWFDGINVQCDRYGNVNKRLRSKRRWKRVLKENGFSKVRFFKNDAYLHIGHAMPENNLLVAVKG